ncbi:MAG: signal recognition particle-docking protein FtsY [Atribacterota bacterium]|nr:signal recognition particle-docking protein FtsY [Atribacterota bacterium]MDD4896173.1 signal recognition particle-docking protein FtsY [Atribacterota bacterium]MDD5637668.1 signal recognition particle-docking protein FtsY [Atribacterota bacterium]
MLFSDAVKDKNLFLDKIEELLLLSDIGPRTTEEILARFQTMNIHQFKMNDFNYFKKHLKQILIDLIPRENCEFTINPEMLNIIMIVGVNGTGKTSFAGKLAYYYKNKGLNSLLVPADTFRAGAIEQLTLLSKQVGVEILRTSASSDPASVVFDGIQSAKAKKKVLLIIDTAGRLHTYNNLMKELEKIKRVINKNAPWALLNTILVIDATTGQNGLVQASNFKKSLEISSIVLTKLDGTAKGGIALTIQKDLFIPVSFITFGEKITDLSEYIPEKFIEMLLD